MKFILDAIQFFPNLMQPLPHIENIYHLHFFIYCCFLLLYPVWIINIWTATSKICFIKLAIHQLSWIMNKMISSHRCFQISMISWTKWINSSIHNNFICIIIRREFYIITPWVHYTLFFSIFQRSKVNCNF